MTNLLERYLQAVGAQLPVRRREDILSELRDDLLSQVEEHEGLLGRALTDQEMANLLVRYGRPLEVAARYLPQHHLIGPSFFPVYWYALRRVLVFAVAIFVLVQAIVMVTIGPAGPTARGVIAIVLQLPGLVFQVAAWVTLIFAALEFVRERYGRQILDTDWDPRKLPALEGAGAPRSQWKEVAGFVINVLFAVWVLAAVPRHMFLLLGPGAYYLHQMPVRPGAFWYDDYWRLVGLLAAGLVVHALRVFVPWARLHIEEMHLVAKAIGIAVLVLLATAGEYVAPADASAAARHMASAVNYSISLGLRIATVIVVLQFAWEGGKWAVKAFGRRGVVHSQ